MPILLSMCRNNNAARFKRCGQFLCVPAGIVLAVASGGVISSAAETIVSAAGQRPVPRRNKCRLFCCVATEKCWFWLFFVQRRNKYDVFCCVAAKYGKDGRCQQRRSRQSTAKTVAAKYGKDGQEYKGLRKTTVLVNCNEQRQQTKTTINETTTEQWIR